jgi:hypothetical protein
MIVVSSVIRVSNLFNQQTSLKRFQVSSFFHDPSRVGLGKVLLALILLSLDHRIPFKMSKPMELSLSVYYFLYEAYY